MMADNRTASSAAVACDHCGLPVPKGLVNPDTEQQFCCSACELVYETIHAEGLDRYYRLRKSLGVKPDRATSGASNYASYDTPAFSEKHVRKTSGALSTIDLRLEGIHCAACLWLVERLPQVVPGVADVRLSLRDAVARVTWDPTQVKLSGIATSLVRLGYPPHPADDVSASQLRRREERRQLARLGVAGALAGNTMLIALALYAGLFTGMEQRFVTYFRWVSVLLGVAAMAWPGLVFFRGAWAAIVTRRPNLDLPIAIALAVGGAAGVVNTVLARGDIYFDSLSVLVFLLLVGRWFQARQQRWADEAVGLMFSFTPPTCRVVEGGEVFELPVDSLQEGQTVEVRSGDLLPADGIVVEGGSHINQALLTGESEAVPVSEGDEVFAGTQNQGGLIRVRVTAVQESTRVGGLMKLVDQGVREKPMIVQFTDRAAGWFVAAVLTAALATFVAWCAREGVAIATDHTVALLIVACPCALGLATPLTMALSLGIAARRNLLVKNAGALERLTHGGQLLLDKTGTLTLGRPAVVHWEGPEELKSAVAAAERDSQHPIGASLHRDLSNADLVLPKVTGVEERGDGGIAARLGEKQLVIGNPAFIHQRGHSIGSRWSEIVSAHESQGRTVVVISVDGQVEALAALQDPLRDQALESVQRLRAAGWRPEILSGDAPGVVLRIAEACGVEADSAHASQSPEDKLVRVKDRSTDGAVVMVGDGVNDAAALAAADVGIAVHGGAKASLAAADIYIAQPGLAPLVDLVRHARRTMRVVRRNLAISLAYNTLGVTLAACGLITPLVAAVLMPISSAVVLGSAAAGFRRSN